MAENLVLILTRDEGLHFLVELLLEEVVVDVMGAADPSTIIKELGLTGARLLIVDTAVSGSLDSIKEVRREERDKIPIVALVHHNSYHPNEETTAALAAGADHVIFKETVVSTLAPTVVTLLNEVEARSKQRQQRRRS